MGGVLWVAGFMLVMLSFTILFAHGEADDRPRISVDTAPLSRSCSARRRNTASSRRPRG